MAQFVPNMPGGAGTNPVFGSRFGMYGGGPGFMYDPQQEQEFSANLKQQGELAGLQSRTQLQQAAWQKEAAELPAQLRQQRFNTVWPWATQQLGNIQGSLNAASGQGGGGGPQINTNPIWNPAQIQQQQNQQRSQVDAATQANIRQSQQKMAGQGYGANSPLSQALQAQYANQGLATNAQQAQQIAWNAAQGNAQQVLSAQQAAAQEYAQQQQQATARMQIAMSPYNALIAALGGAIQG